MSLYNQLFGINDEMPILLGMLGLNIEYFTRFRDVDLAKKGTVIRVFTRTGGENRKYHTENWGKIRGNKYYLCDYDDKFDNTYAYIEFNIPQKYQKTAKKMFKKEPETFEKKFKRELEEMQKEGTDAAKRASAIANNIIRAINKGNNFIEI